MANLVKWMNKRSKNNAPDVEFEYTGNDESIPDDVTHVRFHPSVVEIQDKAFHCYELKEVVLNEGLKKIGKSVFSYCKLLESIELPSTVVEIEEGAFYNCRSLEMVVLNDGLTKIGKRAFSGCESLGSVTLPSTVEEIGSSAFYATTIRSIKLPSNFTEVKEEAFNGCYKLNNIVLNEGLLRIGKDAFKQCKSLDAITLPSTLTEISLGAFMLCSSLRTVVVNKGLQSIGWGAFKDCKSLLSIDLSHTLIVEIPSNTFGSCTELKKVVLNESIKKIGQYTFSACFSLQSINLPSTLVEIGINAFYNCRSLKDIVFSEGLKTIGGSAFGSCPLTSITLPSSLIKVDDSFGENRNLRELVINEGPKEIGVTAFTNCVSLEKVSIPSTVTKIENWAFSGCSNLRDVQLKSEIAVFSNTNQLGKVFTRCSSLERIKFETISKRLKAIIQIQNQLVGRSGSEIASRTEAENKIDEIRGLMERQGFDHGVERNGTDLYVSASLVKGWYNDSLHKHDDIRQGSTRALLVKIDQMISYYEMKEATTLLELGLWKAKIDKAGDDDGYHREACRIEVPGPVKETILQYLYHTSYMYNWRISPVVGNLLREYPG